MATIDRRPYESAVTLNQTILDLSHDNLTMKLEMIADLETPTGTLRLSDEAKYVGSTYYSPRVTFPVISRTVGDWLSGELEFSQVSLSINNTDQLFSNVLPGGADFEGWIGRRLTIKIGLGEVASTYSTIFTGPITDVGGFSRDTSTFTVQSRSDFESANVLIPDQLLITDDWPDIEDDFANLGAPIIYGDWTANLRSEKVFTGTTPGTGQVGEVIAFPVNGGLASVLTGVTPLRLVIASSPLKSVDTASFVLFKGDTYHAIPAVDVTIVPFTDNQIVDIAQTGFSIEIDPAEPAIPWIYEAGDQFFLKCEGVDLGVYDKNIVAQAEDILTRFTPLVSGNFDGTWLTFKNKSSPPQSAINAIESRVWIQESVNAVEQAASMLEQVRLEPFISRFNLFSLTSLHFDEFDPSPSFSIKNWDVILGSFNPAIDERNNWNRAKGDYSFSPALGQDKFSTGLYRNNDSITQAGITISKLVDFPNLVQEDDVIDQLAEMLRLAGGYAEMIEVVLTPRAFLMDIGDFVHINVNIGAVEFGASSVVGIVREIGYDPNGKAIIVKIWSLQMISFIGYTPPNGSVGGDSITITKET